MTYKIQILQFNTKSEYVPGYPEGSYPVTQDIPILSKIPDKHGKDWYLVFVSCSGNFYSSKSLYPSNNTFPINITAHDGDIIKAWYSQGGIGDHNLSIYPFDGTSDEFFDAGELFVDFAPDSKDHNIEINTTVSAWYDTDKMQSQEVTATVHADLPKSRKTVYNTHSTNTSIIIEISDTQILLDKIFVFYGDDQPKKDSITVGKNTTCQALAVFKKYVTNGSEEVSTIQYPKIPWWEWQEISEKIIRETFKGENGEIFEYLTPRQISGMDPEFLQKAVKVIDNRVTKLKKLESSMTKIVKK